MCWLCGWLALINNAATPDVIANRIYQNNGANSTCSAYAAYKLDRPEPSKVTPNTVRRGNINN